MKALLLAAGLGTRLRPLTEKTPKPLLPVRGRPLLAIHLDQLREAGVNEVLINTHYLHEQFVEFAESYMREHRGISITLSHESELLGSAGTLMRNRAFFRGASDFLVVYADNLTDINYVAFVDDHQRSGADITIAALTVNDADVPSKGIIEVGDAGKIIRFREKPKLRDTPSRLANAGVYCISQRAMSYLPWSARGHLYDFGHDFFPRTLRSHANLRVYEMTERLIDIGTPEAYAAAQLVDWIKIGPRQKVCFLDRDGVININAAPHDYIKRIEDFVFVPGIVGALTLLRMAGYKFIVVTNQRGVALGLMTQDDLDEIHEFMCAQFARYGIEILDVFACTHEIDSCDCRKPKDGLLRQACAKYHIDLAASLLISDSLEDCKMAERFGVGQWIYTERDGFLPSLTSKN